MIAIECKTKTGSTNRRLTLAPLRGANLPQCQRALAESVNASCYFVTSDLHALPQYVEDTLKRHGYGAAKIGTIRRESTTWGVYPLAS
jgi:hypothetical protein